MIKFCSDLRTMLMAMLSSNMIHLQWQTLFSLLYVFPRLSLKLVAKNNVCLNLVYLTDYGPQTVQKSAKYGILKCLMEKASHNRKKYHIPAGTGRAPKKTSPPGLW